VCVCGVCVRVCVCVRERELAYACDLKILHEAGECPSTAVSEHEGISSLDTAAINSHVSLCKRADVYRVYGLGCVAHKTASPYPPHRPDPLPVFAFI